MGSIKLTKKSPSAETSVQIKSGGSVVSESTEQETPSVPVNTEFSTPWCEVGVDASYTHNLGNYESAKVGVRITIPCKHEEIEQVYAVAEDWVNAKISKMKADISGE